MLDCPEQIRLPHEYVLEQSRCFLNRVAGLALAFSLSSLTIHSPFLPTVAAFRPAKETVTFSPLSAQPQIGTGMSRCRTMFEFKTRSNRTPAWEDKNAQNKARVTRLIFS